MGCAPETARAARIEKGAQTDNSGQAASEKVRRATREDRFAEAKRCGADKLNYKINAKVEKCRN